MHENMTWESTTTWTTHYVSSRYHKYMQQSPIQALWYVNHVCKFEQVWAVGRFDVRRSLFVVPQQPRAGTVANRRCFLVGPGHTKSKRDKKGIKSCQKGVLPKLSRDGGLSRCASIPKRGT